MKQDNYFRQWGEEIRDLFMFLAPDVSSFFTGAIVGLNIACLLLCIFVRPVILIPIISTFVVLALTQDRVHSRRNK